MKTTTGWSDRLAPFPLLLVQEFLNTPAAEPTEEELRVGAAIRRDAAGGLPQATLAARYGVSQQLVSAVLRGKRLVGGAAGPGAATFGSPESMRAWLEARDLLPPGERLTAEEHARLLELQSGLRALALANGGGGLPEGAHAALDRLAVRAPLVLRFREPSAVVLEPAGAGADGVVGALLAIVYHSIQEGSWSRLKACPADQCGYAFYDASRNRTATWCSMAICGNRAKVRTYQRRRRTATAE